MKNENNCTHDIPKFRERIELLRGDTDQKDFAKSIGVSVRTYQNWVNPLYKGYNETTSYTLPKIETAMVICEKYGVSLDYLFGRIDCETINNQNINNQIGLNDQGIKGLENIKLSDDNAALNGQPGLCVLPVLNDMLSVYNGSGFEKILQGVRDFMNTDYCVPVYHTEKGVVIKTEKGDTATIETIKSSSPLDTIGGKTQTYIDKKGKKTKFVQETIHIQHFAKENDNYDNKAVAITKEFLAAVALKEIEQGLIELKKDMGK